MPRALPVKTTIEKIVKDDFTALRQMLSRRR